MFINCNGRATKKFLLFEILLPGSNQLEISETKRDSAKVSYTKKIKFIKFYRKGHFTKMQGNYCFHREMQDANDFALY